MSIHSMFHQHIHYFSLASFDRLIHEAMFGGIGATVATLRERSESVHLRSQNEYLGGVQNAGEVGVAVAV